MVKKSKVIIGLGNPGKEYENTRHSIGFKVVDHINKKYGGNFSLDGKSNSELSEIKTEGGKVLLIKPQTFMNNSGSAVKKLVQSHKLKAVNLVVVHDDLDIPFGKVKSSFGRSSGGHRGVGSIIKTLKTDKFHRVRFGTSGAKLARIRKTRDKRKRTKEMNEFVVDPFTPNEKQKLNKLVKIAAEKALQ